MYVAWVTEDLLAKISSNPKLNKWMGDPSKMALLDAIQTNPQKVLSGYQNESDIETFKEFANILGTFNVTFANKMHVAFFLESAPS